MREENKKEGRYEKRESILLLQAEEGIQDLERSRGLGEEYKRQDLKFKYNL